MNLDKYAGQVMQPLYLKVDLITVPKSLMTVGLSGPTHEREKGIQHRMYVLRSCK